MKKTQLEHPDVFTNYDSEVAARIQKRDAAVWSVAIECAVELIAATHRLPKYARDQLAKLSAVGPSYAAFPKMSYGFPRGPLPAPVATQVQPAEQSTAGMLDCPGFLTVGGLRDCPGTTVCPSCQGTKKITAAIARALGERIRQVNVLGERMKQMKQNQEKSNGARR